MQMIRQLRRIFNRDTKVKIAILLVAIIIGALLETLALSIISPFIAILMDNTIIETNRYAKIAYGLLGFSSVSPFLALLTFVLAGVYIFRGVYLFILTKVQYRVLARRQANLSGQLLKRILEYPYLYHSSKNLAEMQRIIVTDVQNLFTLVNSALLLLTDLFMTLFIVVFLGVVSPVMTLFVMLTSLLCVWIYMKAFRKKVRASGEDTRIAQIGMNKAVNQAVGGIKEIKVLGREDFFYRIFKKSSDVFVNASVQYTAFNAIPKLAIESVCFAGAFITIGAMIVGGADITSLIPQLSLFVLAAFRLLPAVSRTVQLINSIIFFRPSVGAVYESLFEEDNFAAASLPAASALPQNTALSADVSDIIVSDLTFQYPNTPAPVLDNVSLTIPNKKSIAFVGASGAGKTTLADLILGVLTPESGGVFYKGKSIHHNLGAWNRCVGYIPQQIYLLDESILENVAFGIDPEEINHAKVWHALEQAQLADFVRSLPEELGTVVGDRGIRLSGGQRQRIGIARAMYEDPPILVLDEATSSLDNDTEKAVMDAVKGFQGNKTMLIVAHRLSTIEHCDVVYRLEDKKARRER